MEDNQTLIKKKILKDDEDIEYILEYRIEKDCIVFKIIENKVYSPFTFEGKFTLNDFIKKHVIFKSCNNLEEVLRHLNNLYNSNRIILNNAGEKDERSLLFNIFNISEEERTKEFNLVLKMTSEKDKALEDLYKIQKEQLELFKKIKSLVKKNKIENKFSESILAALEKLEKYGIKILTN